MLSQVQEAPGAGLDAFFQARGIAVIGASDDVTKIGGRPVQLLLKYGYAGAIYPINPKAGTLQGLQAYASVVDTPTAPDLAIVAVPAQATLQAVRDCAQRGVRGVVVLSTGFAEAGPEGAELQAELVRTARHHGMRLMGPNCLGVVSVPDRIVGTFSIALEQSIPPAGEVGIVSQSGNIGSFTLRNMADRGLGVSRFIATGNEADVDVADGIAALAEDPGTRIILCCMETCRHAGRLTAALEQARRRNKPVIVLKIGATEQGQAAAASHTGALTGSDAVFDAVLRRHGALRVRSFEELLDIGHAAALLAAQRLPSTDAVTLVAASGGFGIMMADAMVEAGMTLPQLSETTKALIREAVPTAGTNNPVDASAQMSARPDILLKMLTALQDDASGSTLVLMLALSLSNPRLRGVYLEALAKIRASHPDRLLVIISQGPADAVAEINALGIPVFRSIPAAATGLAGLVKLGRLASLPAAQPWRGEAGTIDPLVFRNEFHAKKALAAAGIDVPREEVVESVEAAVRAARETGYPVVLKIASEDIAHKTEVGGVALDLRDDTAVREAFARIMASARQHAPQARIDGVLVAPMVRGGVELIAGISRDPVFGSVVMVGFGGIHAEILKDVAVQVAPVSEDEAQRMIRGLRMFPLLDGARGTPRADVAAAARTVALLSEFACRHAAQVAEIDMNPILVKPQGQGVLVLDALMVPAARNTPAP
ncbi:acetate--CoA ligase family protein [Ramlibacter rhizophilus]|uniref:CoA-binding protein n=1 Tax=Ramlibacter rhizophilus TaxID=1781167 RepID=A0A4Z0BYQ1_9BURK|nr:acetate--CoA ligase family protein [Ramlibacter rhizophilus]TFZ04467.1 CoA-binding protein [Ramlibacter rhizophilus]